MLFNSLSFAIFFPIVFFLFWFIANGKLKFQNTLLLLASYFFYGCWDYRFLFLLIFSTLLDYYTGIKIAETQNKNKRRFWFILSIGINLGFLAVFKYYNFFIDSFADGLSLLGIQSNFATLNIILPVGISFYTFHGISYVVDLYKDRIKPEYNIVNYSVFVSFFPLLVAGPIERATHFLPQIRVKRIFNYARTIDGLKQILWGLFKKIVIADNCAEFVNIIYNNSIASVYYSGSTFYLGAVLFSIQIYCDFSGYSDIALGTARCLGFDLLKNFNYPFISKSVTEFWRRWHISLSTWFNDYLFTPMIIKWRDSGKKGIYFALIITFLTAGLWHGAGWNFLIYGLLHGIVLVLEMITKKSRRKVLSIFSISISAPITIFLTFSFVSLAFVFFRSDNIVQGFLIIKQIFSESLFIGPYFPGIENMGFLIYLIIIFFIIEWFGRNNNYPIEKFGQTIIKPLRWLIYYLIICSILYFRGKEQEFIYFQF